MPDPNPPAFPRPSSRTDATGRPERAEAQDGMGLRDYLAAQALLGYLAHHGYTNPAGLAETAYQIADAMLARRART